LKKPICFAVLALIIFSLPYTSWVWSQEDVASIDMDLNQDLSLDIELIETKVLEAGINKIHGSYYHKDSLWFLTRTDPTRVLKMDPQTLEYEMMILEGNNGADLIGVESHIFVITGDYPSKIIKINVDNFTVEETIEIQGINHGGSLAYAFDYLWAGGWDGKLAKINLTTSEYEIYDYPTWNQFHALEAGEEYLWGSCPVQNPLIFIYPETTLFRINPAYPLDYNSVTIRKIVTDDMVYHDGALYVGTENLIGESYIYKVFKNLTYIPATTKKATRCYGTFQDNSDSGTFWAAYTGSPGFISKFDSELNLEGTYQLPEGFNDANEIVFDGNGYAYITCFSSPARVVKIQYNNASS